MSPYLLAYEQLDSISVTAFPKVYPSVVVTLSMDKMPYNARDKQNLTTVKFM